MFAKTHSKCYNKEVRYFRSLDMCQNIWYNLFQIKLSMIVLQ